MSEAPSETSGEPTSTLDRFDIRIDEIWEQTLRGRPGLDRMFYLASELADFSVIWQLVGLAQGCRRDADDVEATVRLGTVLLIESALVNQGVKRLFRRRRPGANRPHPHNLRIPRTSSFPSGHASAAFTAAGILAQRDRQLAPLIYVGAAVVATSRVHVRVHHASDVLAGAALGAAFAFIANRLWPLPARPA